MLNLLLHELWLTAIARNEVWEMMQRSVCSPQPTRSINLRSMILVKHMGAHPCA